MTRDVGTFVSSRPNDCNFTVILTVSCMRQHAAIFVYLDWLYRDWPAR